MSSFFRLSSSFHSRSWDNPGNTEIYDISIPNANGLFLSRGGLSAQVRNQTDGEPSGYSRGCAGPRRPPGAPPPKARCRLSLLSRGGEPGPLQITARLGQKTPKDRVFACRDSRSLPGLLSNHKTRPAHREGMAEGRRGGDPGRVVDKFVVPEHGGHDPGPRGFGEKDALPESRFLPPEGRGATSRHRLRLRPPGEIVMDRRQRSMRETFSTTTLRPRW